MGERATLKSKFAETSTPLLWRILATHCKSTIRHSKMQLGCRVEGWAVFGRGSALVKAKGETILQCLRDFDLWRTHLEDMDFVTALNHHLNQLQRQKIPI
ncbi:hypothetical protein Pint_28832 [Pistacia integerrima]|uniref:Uncharacterized protein n=1 Tax=Pistacia integerrima TaxID=434235 RepID=A0ACC0X0Y2_9ROSI|nr:hypothetical protein Pint_28832 [Pistacia integerrima]